MNATMAMPEWRGAYVSPLSEATGFPLACVASEQGHDLADWAAAHAAAIDAALLACGAVLLRGFDVSSLVAFRRCVDVIGGDAQDYRERSSPRTQFADKIYTSTEYPASHRIFLHNENSYQRAFPRKLFFHCVEAAAHGGSTPIASCREVTRRMHPDVRDEFRRKGWMYVRNFADGFGLPWTTVFGTSDRAGVERYCAERQIAAEWKGPAGLRIRAVLPAFTRHPHTDEQIWFNHALFFHASALEPQIREALESDYAPDDMPTNTFFGDGTPIPAPVLDHLRTLFASTETRFDWVPGDVMVLDNLLIAHGRDPYKGSRKILVAMAEPVTRPDDVPWSPA